MARRATSGGGAPASALPTMDPTPLAAASTPRLKLVLGLGNPGAKYVATRHNVGFRVVDELARRRALRLEASACRALAAQAPGLILAQPQTYMNRSGYAARCFTEHRGVAAADMLIVYDDVYLPLGKLRLRRAGSPGGHRGMESVLENLCTSEVPRLRLGIAAPAGTVPAEELGDFVLEPFAADEQDAAQSMVVRAADAVDCWLVDGAAAAMNRFNG